MFLLEQITHVLLPAFLLFGYIRLICAAVAFIHTEKQFPENRFMLGKRFTVIADTVLLTGTIIISVLALLWR